MQAKIYDFFEQMLPGTLGSTALSGVNGLITGITIKAGGQVRLDLLLEQPLPADLLCEMEAVCESHLPANEVLVRQRFGNALSPEDAARYAASLKQWLIRHLWKSDAVCASMLNQASFKTEGRRVLMGLHEACCSQFDETGMEHLQQLFADNISEQVLFVLSPTDANLQDLAETMNNGHMAMAHQIQATERSSQADAQSAPPPSAPPQTGKPPARQYRRQKKPEDVFWGKWQNELTTSPIDTLNSESGIVLIEGEVFNMESRPVSNNTRILVKFGLTDYGHSINCILFIRPEAQEEIEQNLKGCWIRLIAEISFDSQFSKDLQARVIGLRKGQRPPGRSDTSAEKRVELHAHTKMSSKDSVCDPSSLAALAASFGHPAIAVTDHGVVQAFPDIANAARGLKKSGKPVKVIYGMEGYLVDDGDTAAFQVDDASLDDGFVAIDVETTGLDPATDRLIEVAAVWFSPDGQGGFKPVDSLQSLINPGIEISARITELTGISNEMVGDSPDAFSVLEQLIKFVGSRPVVAHNAFFDIAFLRYEGFRTRQVNDPRLKFNPPAVDTLALSRALIKDIDNHKLKTVCAHLGIELDRHHRADADAEACGRVFANLYQASKAGTLAELNQLVGKMGDEQILAHKQTVYHVVLLAKDDLGLYNLYRLVSDSHIRYFHMRPRIPKSLLQYFRSGLIVGSACERGEVFQAIREIYLQSGNQFEAARKSLWDKSLVRLSRFYDYLEIQPLCNNRFYLRNPDLGITTEEDLKNLNRLVVQLGEQLKKPVCATGDVHFIEKRHGEYRKILQADMGFSDAEDQAELYYRTTGEMLDEFAFLGEQTAREVVISNPNRIADQIQDDMLPFPDGSFPPIIASAAEDVRQSTWDTALSIYGRDGVVPELVKSRVERELSSIIDNGFAIMYYIAEKLVKKSNDDGYIVGSRGSVGSSLVATLCGISEVNPLPPHYVCPGCHYSEFVDTGEYGSGYDLPDKACPECGAGLLREGQDIPFETFLGFNGDKQPDIDLNFSGEYQARAHRFIEEMFGSSHTFRAGTIGGYAEKNAMAIVSNYFKEQEKYATQAEISRLSNGLIGVKRTTGQHPGGIVVVPKEREIFDFTPIQHPADKKTAGTITTHFDFNAMHDTILKLDILGHDDPTMLKMLGDLTGVDVRTIPIPDAKVMSLFQSTEALGIPDGTATSGAATLGLPEMGTFMARDMIRETRPSRFFDLVQLMGLSHGTDVWKGNAQELIRQNICTIDEVIGCRDSIMTWLIHKNLPPKAAFDIMEKVRKGRGLSEEHEQLMRDNNVPDWYIESCKKIRYMFPKAHAAAYTISSLRIAWFKVYHPEAYYCAYFTVRADEFDSRIMCQPPDKIRFSREQRRKVFRESTDREQKMYYILEIVEEMQLRGIDFVPIDLYESQATAFVQIEKGLIRPPLNAIPSISTAISESIVRARADGPFKSRDELMRRAGIGQSAVEILTEAGCLEGLPATSQIDLFELMG